MAENANLWPVGVVSCATCTKVQIVLVGQMEPEHDLEVAELLESFHRVRSEPRVVDTDDACVPPQRSSVGAERPPTTWATGTTSKISSITTSPSFLCCKVFSSLLMNLSHASNSRAEVQRDRGADIARDAAGTSGLDPTHR